MAQRCHGTEYFHPRLGTQGPDDRHRSVRHTQTRSPLPPPQLIPHDISPLPPSHPPANLNLDSRQPLPLSQEDEMSTNPTCPAIATASNGSMGLQKSFSHPSRFSSHSPKLDRSCAAPNPMHKECNWSVTGIHRECHRSATGMTRERQQGATECHWSVNRVQLK